MPKEKNKKRSRQSLFSKGINVALILLGFSRPLTILGARGFTTGAAEEIVAEATFGLGRPTPAFDLGMGLRMYTPVAGAVALGTLKTYLLRKFPVRR